MTKKVLQLIGDFREMGYEHHPNAPSLVDAKGKRTPDHKTDVLSYLRKAKSINFSPGVNTDLFDPTQIVAGDTMRTDGTYVWPAFLADYVERYDVELPEPFERHMAARAWKLPTTLDVTALEMPF